MEKCEDNLERVQKSAFKIILGESYVSYDNAKGFEVAIPERETRGPVTELCKTRRSILGSVLPMK